MFFIMEWKVRLKRNAVKASKQYKEFSRKLRWFTPIGEADTVIRSELNSKEKNSQQYNTYRKAYRKYRYFKRFEVIVKILFYAGIVTSVAATLGFGLEIIDRLASYIGFSVLLVAYLVSRYLVIRAKENLYVRREILLSRI